MPRLQLLLHRHGSNRRGRGRDLPNLTRQRREPLWPLMLRLMLRPEAPTTLLRPLAILGPGVITAVHTACVRAYHGRHRVHARRRRNARHAGR